MLKKDFYFLSPIEVVKVTKQNLEEVAEWCGGKVLEAESRKAKGRMDKYVWVPTPKGSNVSWAFPGMYVTKRLVITDQNTIKETWAVYRRDYFTKNYFETPKAAADATWERAVSEGVRTVKQEVSEATTNNIFVQIIGDPKNVNVEKELDKQIDALHGLGAAAALNDAIADGSIFGEKAYTDSNEWPIFKHTHVLSDGCDLHDCDQERYANGNHIFTDVLVVARPEEAPEIMNNNEANFERVFGSVKIQGNGFQHLVVVDEAQRIPTLPENVFKGLTATRGIVDEVNPLERDEIQAQLYAQGAQLPPNILFSADVRRQMMAEAVEIQQQKDGGR